ncbi:hypothetical protein THAOC_08976, partial [Thalassiosira oceanica]
VLASSIPGGRNAQSHAIAVRNDRQKAHNRTCKSKKRKEKKKKKIFNLHPPSRKSEVNWAHDGRDHWQVGQYKLQAAHHSCMRAIESSIMLLTYDIGVPREKNGPRLGATLLGGDIHGQIHHPDSGFSALNLSEESRLSPQWPGRGSFMLLMGPTSDNPCLCPRDSSQPRFSLKMETDSDFEDGSAADVDAPAPEDDTGTSGAVGYDKDAGDAIHNGHVHYDKGEDNLFERIFGEDSELFANAFKKIGVEYAEFVAFIATFYLECRLRTTLSRLVDDRDINTDRYMSHERYARVTMLMTQRQLKEYAEEFGLVQFMKWSGKVLEQRKRYAAMLESLLYNDDEEEETPIETGESAHLIEYLKAWFMSPLNKGSNESRAATHEKRFLKQAFECIKANHTGASVDAIYAPGLSRCSPRTYDKEMKQIEDVRRMMEGDVGLLVDGNDSRPLYAVFDGMFDTAADDDDTSGNSDSGERHYTVNPILCAAIPDANELIQIMHHTVTWAIDNTCFFVVGGYSRVLAIYEVRFPEELLHD